MFFFKVLASVPARVFVGQQVETCSICPSAESSNFCWLIYSIRFFAGFDPGCEELGRIDSGPLPRRCGRNRPPGAFEGVWKECGWTNSTHHFLPVDMWLWLKKPGIPKWVALVSGNMDQHMRNPSCLILSRTHLVLFHCS